MSKKDKFLLLLVFVFALLASRDLFRVGYFPMHDDLQMMRQLQLERCFLDFQIPCRWVPDMGFGFGFPLFNFYPPLPYLVGQVIRLFGATFVTTAKVLFAISLVASGLSMYLLAKDFFGRIGGALSAIFYIWAPYHAVDVYVRGAMNESWALAFFPLILWSVYKLIRSDKAKVTRWVIVLAMSWFAILTSHNLMVLIFTPIFVLWTLLILWIYKGWRKVPYLGFSGILAFGLAAFFTIPAMLENKLTQIRGQLVGYYDYTAHFVSLRQLFISRFWGHGPSVWVEAEDGMSFQIGHVHWILALLLTIAIGTRILWLIFNNRSGILRRIDGLRKHPILLTTFYLLLVGWFAAYLTHLRSIWIYQVISQLSYVQFPWRFLTVVIFAFSFAIGAIPGIFAKLKSRSGLLVKIISTPPQLVVTCVLTLTLVLLSWNYFTVERMGPVTDEEKFSGEAWRIQQTAGIYDYLPTTAKTAPKSPRTTLVDIMNGEGEISDGELGTNWAKFNSTIESEEAVLRISIFQFPEWRVFACPSDALSEGGTDGCSNIPTYVPDSEEWGRMYIDLPKGEYKIEVRLFDTAVRRIGNYISIITWVGLIGFLVYKRKTSAAN
jgi:hypothetical protein